MSAGKVMSGKEKKIISERRRYVRISPPKPIRVRYHFVKGYDEPQASPGAVISSNVSGGGLFLELPYLEAELIKELLKGEKELSLEIDIPNIAQPIKALAQVVWMEGRKGGYGVGVSFLNIDENDRDEIINYIIDLYLKEKKFK